MHQGYIKQNSERLAHFIEISIAIYHTMNLHKRHMSTGSAPSDPKIETYPETSARLRRPSAGLAARPEVRPEVTVTKSPRCSFSERKLSSGEIIDLMEKEQDAIVLKLTKEIRALREENAILRAQVAGLPSRRASASSTSSNEKPWRCSSVFNVEAVVQDN